MLENEGKYFKTSDCMGKRITTVYDNAFPTFTIYVSYLWRNWNCRIIPKVQDMQYIT